MDGWIDGGEGREAQVSALAFGEGCGALGVAGLAEGLSC